MTRLRSKTKFLLVRKEGNSKVLTATAFLPLDWQMVEIAKITRHKDDRVTVTFKKVA